MATKAKTGKKASANGKLVAPSPLDVLTLDEAAAYLRLAVQAVRTEAEAGRIPGQKLGGDWRFLRGGIAQWLSSPVRLRPANPSPGARETQEEFDAFQASLAAYRDEVDHAAGSGKYAPE